MNTKKSTIVFCIISGTGFIMALIGMIVLASRDSPIFPTEFSVDVLFTHPLALAVISGSVFVVALYELMKKGDGK